MTAIHAGALADDPRFDDAAAGEAAPEIVVFAIDGALAGNLRTALPHSTICAADTVSALADLLVARPCRALGVEVAALGAGAVELLARLAGLFPDLPIVALGSVRDARVVAPLLASGEVHAFLARPISTTAARDAFDSAFRRNAALIRSADLRRAVVLRHSSTFLVHESRADATAPAAPSTGAAARSSAAWPRTRVLATAAFALLGALAIAGWLATGPHRHAAGAEHAAAHVDTPVPTTAAMPAPAQKDEIDTAASAAVRAAAQLDRAREALSAGRADEADALAREAARLAGADASAAATVAAVLDEVATARLAAERESLARARWQRAAREWRRMRAAEAAAVESHTSEATRSTADAPAVSDAGD